MDEANYYKQIIKSGKISILDWNLTQDSILISESLQSMLGYPNTDSGMTKFSISEIFPEKDLVRINKVINKQQSEHKSEFSLQHVMIQKDGFHCWVSQNGTINYDKQGEPIRLVSSIVNISEMKEYESALSDTEKIYHTYIASAPYGVFIVDDKGNYLEVNKAASKILGYKELDLLLMNIKDILDPKFLDKSLSDFQHLLKYGKMDVVSSCITKDGTSIKLSINAVRIDENRYIGFCQDVTQKINFEDLIIKSEEKFRSLMEQSPLSVQVMSLDGKIKQVNSSFKKLWSITEEVMIEVYQKYNILEDEQLKKLGIIPLIEKAFAGETVTLPPIEYDAPDTMEALGFKKIEGRKRWIQSQIYPLKNNDGDIINMILLAEDITERTQIKKDLQESEEQFKRITEQSFDVVVMFDSSGVVQYTSPAITKMFGYNTKELLGKNLLDYVPQSELEKTKNSYMRIFQGQLINNKQSIYRKKDGTYLDIIVNAVPIYEHDKIIGGCGFLRDVTELNRTLQKLKDSEEKYKNITERSFDSIYILDTNLNLEYISPSMTNHFGHKLEDVIGKSVLDFIPESDFDTTKTALQEVLSGNRLEFDRAHIIRTDGTVADLEVNVVPIYKSNKIVGVQGMIRDVTERNEAERKLKKAETDYQNLFESAPVSIWREDFSEIKLYIDELRKQGITNFKIYFDENPNEIMKCVSMLKVININYETVNLLKAKNKQEVLSSIDKTFTADSLKTFKNELLCLITGEKKFNSEVKFKTFENKIIRTIITVYLDTSVSDWSNVIITIIDITKLKSAEQALKASEEKYRELFDASMATIYLFDSQKNFIDTNQAGLDLLGYTRDELFKLSISDVDAAPIEVVDAHKNLSNGDNLINFEHRLKCKDGTIITVLNNSKPLIDSEGNIIGIQSTLMNITERKQSEKALKESEKKYRNLFEVAQEGILVIDTDSYTTLVNKSMADMLGYSIDEMIGKHLFHFMDETGIEIAKYNIERRKSGIKEQHDFQFLTKEGKHIFTTIETAPIFDENQKYIGAIAGVVDITDRKAAEDELLASKKQYDQILDRSNAVVYIKDLNHKYLYANAVFYNLFKLDADYLIGKTDYDLFSKEQADEFIENDIKVVDEQKYFRVHEKVMHYNVTHTYISDKFPLYDSNGEIYATCGISTDITDLIELQQKEKYIQQELVKKDRLINVGHLSAAIAHEINNPMTVLHGTLEEIKESKDALNDEILESMLRVSRRIKKIINNLLIFTRQEEHYKELIDINSIIQNTFLLISNLLHKSSIEIRLDLSKESLNIEVNQVQLQQVFINIIFNAMHAMKSGGLLIVKSCRRKNNICISFEDNGVGINEENLKSIFLPFFTTKEVGEGTGLGLSLSHGIIEEHGGNISVTSKVNKGSTFTVSLPVS